MSQTVTGDRITEAMHAEADEFFEEFAALCRRHGVWLQTRKSETVWRFAAKYGRPAFEIPQNGG
jgi:hypothetical protein